METKHLISLLLAASITSNVFADTFACTYLDGQLVDTTATAPTSTKTNIAGINFAVVSSIDYTKIPCQMIGNYKADNPLTSVKIKKNNEYLPILDRSIVDTKNVGSNLTTYVNKNSSKYLLDNLSTRLNTMVNSSKEFLQFDANYDIQDAYILLHNDVKSLHSDKGKKSEIYNNNKKPKTYNEAVNGLSNTIYAHDAADADLVPISKVTLAQANLIASFIVNYDHFNGFGSLPRYLSNSLTDSPVIFNSPFSQIFYSYNILDKGIVEVTVTNSYSANFMIADTSAPINAKTGGSVLFEMKFEIDTLKSTPQKLVIYIDKNNPIEALQLNATFNSANDAQLAKWLLTNITKNTVSYAEINDRTPTDSFIAK